MVAVSSLLFLGTNDPSPYPDLTKVIETQRVDIVVIEDGMSSGRPAVALKIDLPDGQTVIAQTSARLFCTHAKAIMARYPELFNDN